MAGVQCDSGVTWGFLRFGGGGMKVEGVLGGKGGGEQWTIDSDK